MSDIEQEGNAYNQKKAWHTGEVQETPNSDNLFVAPTKKAEPVKTATSTDKEGDVSNANHDYEKRWKDLKSHHDKTVAELRQKLNSKDSTKIEEFKPPKTKEDLEKFKAKNPEQYDVIQSLAHLIASEQTTTVKEKLSEIEGRELKVAKQVAMEKIKAVHEDFDTLKEDDSFHQWAESQPEQIQDWIYNNPTNGDLAIKAINLYKAETGSSKTKQKEVVQPSDGADSLVSTKNTNPSVPQDKKIWTTKEIKSLSLDQYEKYEADIDAAMREGRVV